MFNKFRDFKHLDIIFDSVSEMAFLISVEKDGSFRYITANRSAILSLQFPADFEGKTVQDLMPPRSADIITGKYQEAIQTKEPLIYEEKMELPNSNQPKNKKMRWLESRVTPIFDEDGQCKQLISVTRDVTLQKEREEELRTTKEQLEVIIDHAADGVFTFDKSGKYLTVNPGFTDMFGWTEEEVLGDSPVSILTESNREEFSQILARLRRGEVIRNSHSYRRTKYGKTIHVLSSYAPIITEGEVTGGVAIYKDISALAELEGRLQESQDRYRIIAEHSNDLIRITNREGEITYASPSHRKMLGIDPRFFIGKSFLTLINQKDMAKMEEWFEKIIETQESSEVEFRGLNKFGDVVWFEAIGGPVKNLEGEVDQVVIVSRDISDRKTREEKLETMALHDELTGLPNRTLFDDRLEQALHLSDRTNTMTALFALDCDRFKEINDTMGHDVGDEVIKEIAKRIQDSIRTVDTVSRMGGDEFQVVLPELKNKSDAQMVGERILSRIEQPTLIDGESLSLSVSIGISYYVGEEKTKEALMKEADEALYISKDRGRNTITEYGDGEG